MQCHEYASCLLDIIVFFVLGLFVTFIVKHAYEAFHKREKVTIGQRERLVMARTFHFRRRGLLD